MIKAVLFDLDGTLLDRARSLIHFAEQQHYRWKDILGTIPLSIYVRDFVELDRNGHVWKDNSVCEDLLALPALILNL